MEGPDVLENFDFDSFLPNTDDNNRLTSIDFMTGLDPSQSSESKTEPEPEEIIRHCRKIPNTPLHSLSCFPRPQSPAQTQNEQDTPREKKVERRKGSLVVSERQQSTEIRRKRPAPVDDVVEEVSDSLYFSGEFTMEEEDVVSHLLKRWTNITIPISATT